MNAFLARYRWAVLAVVGAGLIAGYVASRTVGGDDPAQVRGRLGPTPGPDASGYIADKSAHLEASADADPEAEVAALVSLAELVRPVDVTELAAGARVDLVFTLFPGEDPGALAVRGTVDVTVGERAAELAGTREAEIAALEEQAKSSSGAERDRRLKAASAKSAEVTALRGQCRCVYAFVVRGAKLSSLVALQGLDSVRLVDTPDPVVADLRGWELTPLLSPDVRAG